MEGFSYPSPRAMTAVFEQVRRRSRKLLFEFLATVPRDDFVRSIPEAGDRSLRDVLVHLVGTNAYWISLLQNRPQEPLRPDDLPTIESIVAVHEEVADRIHHVLANADEGWFTREETFSHPRGKTERLVPAWVTVHMLTHEFHHKGQIAMMARILGYTPPDMDFI